MYSYKEICLFKILDNKGKISLIFQITFNKELLNYLDLLYGFEKGRIAKCSMVRHRHRLIGRRHIKPLLDRL